MTMPDDTYIVRWGPDPGVTSAPRVRLAASDLSYLPAGVSRRIAPVTEPGQAYYWTHAWQAGEQESLAARAVGDTRVFGSADDAIRYLLSADED
jgi:hypothetical protein